MTPGGKKVFIGHGRSAVWRDLRDFVRDKLRLETDEYNAGPAAGYFTPERVKEMLDNAAFAFLVLTAEDEQGDGTMRARENVVHEAGLFQGRLGFRKAIVVLEEGCNPFSNIEGLTRMQFPKGNIRSIFQEAREILEREKLL
jgi:predicted nucleotide-binding protein